MAENKPQGEGARQPPRRDVIVHGQHMSQAGDGVLATSLRPVRRVLMCCIQVILGAAKEWPEVRAKRSGDLPQDAQREESWQKRHQRRNTGSEDHQKRDTADDQSENALVQHV